MRGYQIEVPKVNWATFECLVLVNFESTIGIYYDKKWGQLDVK